MKIVSLRSIWEPTFWEHVNQNIPHYYFFAFDWKHNREKTEILLALEGNKIEGMMLVYDKRIVQLRGSNEAAKSLLDGLDLERVELQSLEEHKHLVLKNYKPTLKQSHEMMLMLLHTGEEELQMKWPAVVLDASHAERIASIMREADPEYWGDTSGQQIIEGMNRGMNWFGIKVDDELVSIGSSRLTEWAGLIGVVATHEKHRNMGYATSVVSSLVKRILEKLSPAMIFVLADNLPAIRAYTKVGFKPCKTYFFMRGEKRLFTHASNH